MTSKHVPVLNATSSSVLAGVLLAMAMEPGLGDTTFGRQPPATTEGIHS